MTTGIDTNYSNYGYGAGFSPYSMGYQAGNSFASAKTNTSGTDNLLNFSGNGLMQVNNYENDFMMPDFLKMSSIQNNQTTVEQPEQTAKQNQKTKAPQAFTGDAVNENTTSDPAADKMAEAQSQLKNSLLARDKRIAVTENGNLYRTTDTSKKSLAFLGFLAPMAGKIVQLCKGGKFSELFKFKQLAIACPAVAVAGFGIGYLIDSYINSQRAKAVDNPEKQNQTYSQTNTQNQQLYENA